MEQVLIWGTQKYQSAATLYCIPQGGRFDVDVDMKCTMPTAGTLSQLRVVINGLMGGGNTLIITVRKNGVDQALTCTITDPAFTANDMVNSVAVAAGDLINVSVACSGGNVKDFYMTMKFTGSVAGESIIISNCYDTPILGTEYTQVSTDHADWTGVENDRREVIPTAGTIKSFYITLKNHTDSAGKGWKYTIRKNGIDTAVSVTILDGDLTGNSGANSVAVAAGDIVTLKVEPINAPDGVPRPTAHFWGLVFVPAVDGESIYMNCHPFALPTGAANRNCPVSKGDVWDLADAVRQALSLAVTMRKLYILLSAAPGAGKSYTFALRRNAADTLLSVQIADAATTGNDVAHDIAIIQDDKLCIGETPAGVPNAANAYWGFVGFITPPAPPTGIGDKSAHMGQKLVSAGVL